MIEETPEIVEDEAFVALVQNALVQGTELELEFLRSLLGTKQIFGLNYGEMEIYLKYITDRRLQEL
jgi:ribonucleoside-diphosphate reductase beta chain